MRIDGSRNFWSDILFPVIMIIALLSVLAGGVFITIDNITGEKVSVKGWVTGKDYTPAYVAKEYVYSFTKEKWVWENVHHPAAYKLTINTEERGEAIFEVNADTYNRIKRGDPAYLFYMVGRWTNSDYNLNLEGVGNPESP